ncbi:MAG: hypothetical protein ACTHJF_02105, partial [Dyella sp.]
MSVRHRLERPEVRDQPHRQCAEQHDQRDAHPRPITGFTPEAREAAVARYALLCGDEDWLAASPDLREDVRRIILTASGGPFRTWPLEDMRTATLDQALRHPNWSMGQKVTIDSAT